MPRAEWRQQLAAACAEHVGLGPATLVLYDVTTLYFETDQGDGFREPGFSKERRLEPQITVGLLTDVRGFPLQVHAFDGNTRRDHDDDAGDQGVHGRPPAAGGHRRRRRRDDVGGQPARTIEDAGLRFIVGARIPMCPTRSSSGATTIPDEPIPDGQSSSSPRRWARRPTSADGPIFYQYRADRAKRTLHGIDTQIAKAEQAVAGKTAVKRNRFVQLTGGTKTSTATWRPRPAPWPGSRATSPTCPTRHREFVIGAYHQLWQIEKSLPHVQTDLQARPIYHHNAIPSKRT